MNNSLAVDAHDVSSIVVTNTSASDILFSPDDDRTVSDDGVFHDLTELFSLSEFCKKFPSKIRMDIDSFKKNYKKIQ